MRPRLLLVLSALSALLAGAMFLRNYRSSREPIRVVIEKGDSVYRIGRRLADQQLVLNPTLFSKWYQMSVPNASPKPGAYFFTKSQSISDIIQALQSGPPPVRVTFPESWSAKQMAELLEAQGIVSAAEYLAEVKRQDAEGFLFPDTYLFDAGSTAQTVVDFQRKRFNEKKPADFEVRAKEMRLTVKQLVTLASIVEAEARVASEHPLIAGVYWNRLKKKWKLESDPTVQYALGRWKSRLLYEDLKVDSPYNTYRHRGLPPGPIGNPGASALQAAAHPAETPMMFFVAKGDDGTHQFSVTYEEHLRASRK